MLVRQPPGNLPLAALLWDSPYWWAEEEYCHDGHRDKVIPRWKWRRHGWYHVHDDRATCRFCSAYSGSHLSDAPKRALSSRAFASAISRFPPEVIHRIVEWCVKACCGRPWGPGMVCRHWAHVCLRRPMPSPRRDELSLVCFSWQALGGARRLLQCRAEAAAADPSR